MAVQSLRQFLAQKQQRLAENIARELTAAQRDEILELLGLIGGAARLERLLARMQDLDIPDEISDEARENLTLLAQLEGKSLENIKREALEDWSNTCAKATIETLTEELLLN